MDTLANTPTTPYLHQALSVSSAADTDQHGTLSSSPASSTSSRTSPWADEQPPPSSRGLGFPDISMPLEDAPMVAPVDLPSTPREDDTEMCGPHPSLRPVQDSKVSLSPDVAALNDDKDASRRNSVYLPMDSQTPGQDWSWMLSNKHAETGSHEELPLIKSPTQINPQFGLPASGRTAESYQDVQDYSYTKLDNYKASPPTKSNPTFEEKRRVSVVPEGQYTPKSTQPPKSKLARPFFQSASQHSLASLHSPPQRAGGNRELMSLYTSPPRSTLRQRLDSSTALLIYYFAFNLGLTIYNKRVLQGFPFPWTLTGVHTLCGAAGSQIALNYRFFTPSRLTRKENLVLIAFSVLYTVNIAVSNLSLHLVTVPFHQVVRATTPLFTILLSIMFFRTSYGLATYFSLFVVVAGVGLSTYGDYGWTTWGLFLTFLGTLLASMKTVVTNVIQVGRLKLHPLELLLRMSPLAFVQCVVYSWWCGELAKVREYGATQMTRGKAIALFFNGVLAFGLNVVSFTANKKTSALTMTVAANVKQVLTIVLAVFVFDLVITPTNFLGISLTLLGGALYAKNELDQKRKKALPSPPTTSPATSSVCPSPLTNVISEGEKRVRES